MQHHHPLCQRNRTTERTANYVKRLQKCPMPHYKTNLASPHFQQKFSFPSPHYSLFWRISSPSHFYEGEKKEGGCSDYVIKKPESNPNVSVNLQMDVIKNFTSSLQPHQNWNLQKAQLKLNIENQTHHLSAPIFA